MQYEGGFKEQEDSSSQEQSSNNNEESKDLLPISGISNFSEMPDFVPKNNKK